MGVGVRLGGRPEEGRRAGARVGRWRGLEPRGRHGAGPGWNPRHRPPGRVVDRLVPRPGRSVRHRLRVPGTRVRDPRRHRRRRACGARTHRDAARGRPRRPVGRRRRGARARSRRWDHGVTVAGPTSPPTDGSIRPQRARLLARDAAARASRSGSAPRSWGCAPRPPAADGARSPGCDTTDGTIATVTRAAHGRTGDAGGRHRVRSPGVGGLRASPGRRHRGEPGPARRHHRDGVRHRRRHLLAARGGRAALGHVQPRRGTGAGTFDRLAVPATDGAPAPPPAAGHARPRHQEGVGGDDRVHARPFPAHRSRWCCATVRRWPAPRSPAPAATG